MIEPGAKNIPDAVLSGRPSRSAGAARKEFQMGALPGEDDLVAEPP
jgi:hypothetical protein